MTKHVIAGRMGVSDTVATTTTGDERLSEVALLGPGNRLAHGIGGVLHDLQVLGLAPTEIGIDLLVVAAHVYAADTRISRESEAQDSWTREIGLVVPVSDPATWSNAAPILKRLLDFLTGDRWTIAFRARPAAFATFALRPKDDLLKPVFDDIGLFSGGLDSLIGAIDVLKAGRAPLLISHAGEGLVSKAQELCFDGLKAAYPKRTLDRLRLWMNFDSGLVAGVASEDSTRGRSFLFFALGVCAGTALGTFKLRVPENGLIALNVPLDPLRLGALSTRTTHPFYMTRWNDVLKAVGISGSLYNPYWDKTKGEMVAQCADPALLRQLAPLSLSCSHPTSARWHPGKKQGHCGYCLPCLIRRASLLGVDDTEYGIPDLAAAPLVAKHAEGKQIRSFQVAVQRLTKDPKLADILIHKPGPLSDDPAKLADLASVYRRGMSEVGALLKGVRTVPA